MGLEEAQGLYLADSWFWIRDAQTRAWADRFFARQQRMPNSLQAVEYSAATQVLRAVAQTGTTAAEPIVRHLRDATLDDMYVRGGKVRGDGTMLHDMYLLQVKSPANAMGEWDVYDLIATVPGDEAFPLA
jgi:branched-chain amino acid transport system substrate-binding protein